jgi:hypothetical protein
MGCGYLDCGLENLEESEVEAEDRKDIDIYLVLVKWNGVIEWERRAIELIIYSGDGAESPLVSQACAANLWPTGSLNFVDFYGRRPPGSQKWEWSLATLAGAGQLATSSARSSLLPHGVNSGRRRRIAFVLEWQGRVRNSLLNVYNRPRGIEFVRDSFEVISTPPI